MKKTLLIVLGVFIAFGFIVGSFAGGFVVGRVVDNMAAPGEASITTYEESREVTRTPEETPNTEVDGETTIEPFQSEDFDYAILQEVLSLLESDFYGEIPDEKNLAYGAIRGLLFTLGDPYTAFVEPDIADIFNEDASGEFEGIGATVQTRDDGYLEVVRPLPDHPAEAAGLKAGDLILSVDGKSIVGMGLYEAIGLIRGPAGTEVVLEVVRPGEANSLADSFNVTIIRAKMELPIVEYEMLEDNIAYIQLTEFSGLSERGEITARQRVEDALEELQDQGAESLIFDLRYNPGGYLNQAIEVSDLFLGEGLVAIERDSAGNERRFDSYDGDIGEDIPMVVLVNGGSASASEIVAGALQDRNRAILIGENTLGKGSVQWAHTLSDGSQLRVTVARWYTPNDNTIHETGLAADIEVPYSEDTPVGEDPQLDEAVRYLLDNNE